MFLGILNLGFNLFAIEIVQLKDGRKIIINDNYTWEEIKIEEFIPEKKSNISVESITATQADSIAKTIETKALMEKSPELLKSDSKTGVFVSFYKAIESKDKLQVTLMTKNTNNNSVVRVTGEILILDNMGNILDKHEGLLYKGFNRMSETYIREGEQKSFKLNLDKVENYDSIRVIIDEVEFR